MAPGVVVVGPAPVAARCATGAQKHQRSGASEQGGDNGECQDGSAVYRLCKLVDGRVLEATLEDAERLAQLLTPAVVAELHSPALSLSEVAPDSPEPSVTQERPAPTYQKPGGPCDHCSAAGARPGSPPALAGAA